MLIKIQNCGLSFQILQHAKSGFKFTVNESIVTQIYLRFQPVSMAAFHQSAFVEALSEEYKLCYNYLDIQYLNAYAGTRQAATNCSLTDIKMASDVSHWIP